MFKIEDALKNWDSIGQVDFDDTNHYPRYSDEKSKEADERILYICKELAEVISHPPDGLDS